MPTIIYQEPTNLTICQYDSKRPIKSTNYDFIFKELSALESNNVLKLPKFGGRWKIAFIAQTSDEIETLQLLTTIQPIEVDAYCVRQLFTEYSNLNTKSNYQQCIDLFVRNNLLLDKDALTHLYYGTKGNLDIIESFIKDMLKDGVEVVTKQIANKYVVFSRVTYPSDVISSLLVYKNPYIDVRGTSLERYSYRHSPLYYIRELENFLSPEHAFYSVRKAIFKLYKNKIAYLKGADLSKLSFRDVDLVKIIDFKSILYLYLLVQQGGAVPTLARLLVFTHRNSKGDSEHANLHQEKIITGNTLNHFRSNARRD